MPMTPREIAKLLEANGFANISTNGSHRKYRNSKTGKTVIVPLSCQRAEKRNRTGHTETSGAEIIPARFSIIQKEVIS